MGNSTEEKLSDFEKAVIELSLPAQDLAKSFSNEIVILLAHAFDEIEPGIASKYDYSLFLENIQSKVLKENINKTIGELLQIILDSINYDQRTLINASKPFEFAVRAHHIKDEFYYAHFCASYADEALRGGNKEKAFRTIDPNDFLNLKQQFIPGRIDIFLADYISFLHKNPEYALKANTPNIILEHLKEYLALPFHVSYAEVYARALNDHPEHIDVENDYDHMMQLLFVNEIDMKLYSELSSKIATAKITAGIAPSDRGLPPL